MAQYYQSLRLNQAEKLVDVVFGVVVGLSMVKFPIVVRDTINTNEFANYYSPIILIAAIIFSVFYWLEIHHFMNAQESFRKAIRSKDKYKDDAVPLPLATFVLGGLIMIALITGSLGFAIEGAFRAFIIANLLFWVCDFGGTFFLKLNYRRFKSEIEIVKREHAADHGWYLGHIVSKFFYVYALGSVVVYSSILITDIYWKGTNAYVTLSIVILVFTLVRHLYWRSYAYSWWLRKHILAQK